MSEYLKAHEAGLELLGKGIGVPDSLCHLAERLESNITGPMSDGLIAELGRVLLQRRADQAEITELRAKLRATARPSYGTIQLYPEADKPHCPDCGLPVDLPMVERDGTLELEPIGHDDDGPLYAGTCKAGHAWTYQPYAESDDEDEDGFNPDPLTSEGDRIQPDND